MAANVAEPLTYIQPQAETIDACRFCFMCRHVCTLGLATGHESDTPRGKGLVLSRIVQGHAAWSAGLVDSLYRCCLCGMCREWCLGGFDMPSAVLAARRDIVAQGVAPEAVRRIRRNIEETGNPYGLPAAERFARGAFRDRAEVVYYVGCDTAYRQQEIAEAVVGILTRAGADYTLLRDEMSTGKPLTNLGYAAEARAVAERLSQSIRATGCRTLVTACPASYDAFRKDYDGLLDGIEVLHATEYAARLIEEGRLRPVRALEAIVTAHDSDYLGRTNNVYDPPRRVLGAIPGVEVREMSWTREKAHSCGESAGVFGTLYPEIVPRLAARLLAEARATGAGMLVTTCPVTKRALAAADSQGIEVRDAMELLQQSL